MKTPLLAFLRHALLFVIVTLLLVLAIAGCSADYHLRRALKKDPSILLENTLSDTVLLRDTLTIKAERSDSAGFSVFTPDTVRITRGRARATYAFNPRDSTAFIAADCDSVSYVNTSTITRHTSTRTVRDRSGEAPLKIIVALLLVIIVLLAWLLSSRRP
jgi:hypothetical protein